MTQNLTNVDRAIRSGAGLFLLATPILELDTYPLNLLGAVLIATAVVGFCPLYAAVRAFVPKKSSSALPATHGFGQLGEPSEKHAS